MNLILLGPPGAGKGTQAKLLSSELGIPSISTGNILRAAIKEETPIGRKAKEYIDHGALAPDEVVLCILFERLQQEDCRQGYILDGSPRTVVQAQALEDAGMVFDAAIYLDIDDELIIRRMTGRRVCEACGASYHVQNIPPREEGLCDMCAGKLVQRMDDMPQTVRRRLEVYHKQTEPLCVFYEKRGLLRPVKESESVEKAFRDILTVLGR